MKCRVRRWEKSSHSTLVVPRLFFQYPPPPTPHPYLCPRSRQSCPIGQWVPKYAAWQWSSSHGQADKGWGMPVHVCVRVCLAAVCHGHPGAGAGAVCAAQQCAFGPLQCRNPHLFVSAQTILFPGPMWWHIAKSCECVTANAMVVPPRPMLHGVPQVHPRGGLLMHEGFGVQDDAWHAPLRSPSPVHAVVGPRRVRTRRPCHRHRRRLARALDKGRRGVSPPPPPPRP